MDVKNPTNNEKDFYLGVTETPFKELFGKHWQDSKHSKHRNSTELSKYIWKLKDANIKPVSYSMEYCYKSVQIHH